MGEGIRQEPLRQPGPVFYGWVIVSAAFIANFMGSGLGFYIFNSFLEPLCRLRGWTRTDINLGPMLGYIVSILAGLLYGSIIHRVGARVLMTLCSLITALSFYFLGMSEKLPLFYLSYMFMMAGIGGMNGIVNTTAVSNWFITKRGRALGIATAAISLSGVLLTPLAMMLLDRFGLERAFLMISIGIALVAPITWLLIRTRPEEKGLFPDGIATGVGHPVKAAGESSHWTFAMAARSGNFWKIGIAYGLGMSSVLGVMYQLKPRFSDIGFDAGTAVTLMAGAALAGTAGKYGWAHLCDHFSAKNVSALLMACNAVGLLLMFQVHSLPTAILFVAFYGFAMGGVVSTQPVIIAEFFGREAYPSIARFIGIIVGIDCIGYPVMGRSFDLTGSYDTAYAIFIVLNVVAALLVFILRKK